MNCKADERRNDAAQFGLATCAMACALGIPAVHFGFPAVIGFLSLPIWLVGLLVCLVSTRWQPNQLAVVGILLGWVYGALVLWPFVEVLLHLWLVMRLQG